MKYNIIKLTAYPKIKSNLAKWFSQKWNISESAYIESMNACLEHTATVSQWYCALKGDEIIGGMGVIENDFHERKDLTPNICALFVEEAYRGLGIAGKMLAFACADMKNSGIDTLYLLTDHRDFYEKYGWKFYCFAKGDGDTEMSRMYIHKDE